MKNLKFLEQEIRNLKHENRFIELHVLSSSQGPVATIDDKKVINLTSNNYLNFTNHPKIKKAASEAIEKYGIGTAAVRTIIGTMSLHTELEKRLAEFKGTEAALVIQSGFTSNTAVCQAVMNSPEDMLISDELNHASIIDGGRLAKAVKKVYRHKDMKHLEEILNTPEVKKARRRMLVTDGVFSMDGDIAPLPEIVKLCGKYDTFVMVDDAHASGVLGKQGRGTVDHFNLKGKVEIQIGTLSKAFGTIGGYVASTQSMRDYLISTARPFLFSSSHPPSVIATCMAGLDVMYEEPQHLDNLWNNTKFFKEEMQKLGFNLGGSETPIVPVMIPGTKEAKEFSARLFEKGIFALAIGFPTVGQGKERIRNIITSGHTTADLEKAIAAYRQVGKAMGII